MMTESLLAIIVILLILLIFLTLKSKKVEPKDVEAAISGTWIKLGLDEKIGAVESHAKDIRDGYKSFEQMLRVPTERASFGEFSLETIFADQLPQDMYGIRERTLDGKIPDAYIRSTVGIICIDSKFPLDNFGKMLDAKGTKEKEIFKKQFIRDAQGHLDKIACDYVCPEKGSAEFAFAYIPSEGIYYFLVNEGFEMLREYAKRGVQVVSPLTLSHKIELIKAGVHAKKLSEDIEKVRSDLVRLSKRFGEVDEVWRIFYRTHFKNLETKAEELDYAYKKLRDEFERVSKMGEE